MNTSPQLVYTNPEPLTLEQAIERQERLERDRELYRRWKRKEDDEQA